jgi:hypothetical protein
MADRKTGPSVTFETKCYEHDWEYLLKGNRLKKMIRACGYPFDSRVLYINNVQDRHQVESYAESSVRSGVIDSFIHVVDYADEALRFYGCTEADFHGGYYYSIAELVSLYLCKTDYLLHFSSDSIMENSVAWIQPAVEKMERDKTLIVANPTWNHKFHRAKEESIDEDEDFYIGHGFSDQCYLVPASVFRAPIYGENNDISESRFPYYGGELFEKRVDAYMRNHGLLRITSKRASYRHKNYSKNRLKKWGFVHFSRLCSQLTG